jgi:hypothetical protein
LPLAASALVALLSWGVTPTYAHAQDAGAPRSSRALDSGRRVDVTVVAGKEDARELVNTICEVVGRLGLPVRARTLEQAPPQGGEETSGPGLARAEIDLTTPNLVQVLVYGKSGQLVLMQRFARNASEPVLREEIADAVRSAVEAQLLIEPEGQGPTASPGPATGTPPPPPLGRGPAWVSPFSAAVPPVAEPPALVLPVAPPVAPVEHPSGEATSAPKVPMRGVAVDLSALAGIGGFAWQTTSVVGHLGGEVTVAYRKWLNPSLSVTGEYVLPFGASDPSNAVEVHASVASVRVVPAIQVFHTSRFAIETGAGAGIDVINVQPTAKETRIDPVLRGVVAARLGLASRIVLSLAFAYDLDVALHRPRYDVPDDQRIHVLATWLGRPVGFVGLTFSALGDARFTSGVFR